MSSGCAAASVVQRVGQLGVRVEVVERQVGHRRCRLRGEHDHGAGVDGRGRRCAADGGRRRRRRPRGSRTRCRPARGSGRGGTWWSRRPARTGPAGSSRSASGRAASRTRPRDRRDRARPPCGRRSRAAPRSCGRRRASTVASTTFAKPRNRATNSVAGRRQTSCGRTDLLDAPGPHDHDPVGERERLVLVVGDEERGDRRARRTARAARRRAARAAPGPAIRAARRASAAVGRARGRARARPVAARRRTARAPAGARTRRARPGRARRGPACRPRLRDAPLHAQPERDVAEHVAVGEQRVVLEHEPELPPVRRDRGEVLAVPAHASRSSGGSSPATARSSVLLPLPLGPSTHTTSCVGHGEVDAVERDGARRTARVSCSISSIRTRPTSRTRSRSITSTDAAVSDHQDRRSRPSPGRSWRRRAGRAGGRWRRAAWSSRAGR